MHREETHMEVERQLSPGTILHIKEDQVGELTLSTQKQNSHLKGNER